MEDMRRIAFETVLRACGFGSLAIFCVMIGLSFEPRIAFQTGGVLTLVMAGILIFKAQEALTKSHRNGINYFINFSPSFINEFMFITGRIGCRLSF